ncbi:MAG: hypothetical protein C4342_01350, partial [Armatimonadota bacterium]
PGKSRFEREAASLVYRPLDGDRRNAADKIQHSISNHFGAEFGKFGAFTGKSFVNSFAENVQPATKMFGAQRRFQT